MNNNTSMDDLPDGGAAEKAIHHALTTIRENPTAGWHLGAGTETFALLTEALHKIRVSSGNPAYKDTLAKSREYYIPRNAKDPKEADKLGRMTQRQAADGITELRGRMAVLQSYLTDSVTPTSPVETDIDALAEDCGLSADAIRHLVHIARTL